ncbi:succinoglycan biosynthesis transport protein ExoP [Devosia sp. UYZn731]|uniref:GumC family protein n=1 Tax=Devosia sp. UYZn731 TaxID=3156345 RepID=UPI00339802BD
MSDGEIDIRAIFGLLRRQFRLIAITTLAIVAAAGLATLALTPVYTATALIMVDPSRKDLLDPENQVRNSASDSARVESEVELIRSDTVLMQVIEDRHLVSDSEFGAGPGWTARLLALFRPDNEAAPAGQRALGEVLNRLRAAVSAQRRGLTYVIAVQARSENPTHAADLANAITQAYIRDQLASKVAGTLASHDILQARIEQARQAIVASENSYDNFIFDNIDRLVGQSGDSQLANLVDQIGAIKNAAEQNSQTADIVRRSVETANWGELSASLTSDTLKKLARQREEIANSLTQLADSAPAFASLRAELDRLDAELRDAATTELTALQATIAEGRNGENQLRDTLRTAVLNSDLPPGVLTQIYESQQTASIARTQYETLLARAQDLSAQADLQVADSRVVSPALVPAAPSFPNPQLILPLSALAALSFGVGLAFLYENVIGGFSSEEQAESVLRVKVASSLPRLKTGRPDQTSFAELMVNAPISVFSESVRRVRASVDRAAKSGTMLGQGTVVMVSSTAPDEGKTTAALALARSYALSGKSTLLIDCDLRKPSVHRQLGIEPSVGFLDYLTAEAGDAINIQAITARDPLSPATVIAGAHRSSLPTDQLIVSTAFVQLITAARRSFDIVVLDTPPIGPVVDSLYIAQHADVIVFVVRYASTPQTEARKALASLGAAKSHGAEILAVLNQQDSSAPGYSKRYGAYFSQA